MASVERCEQALRTLAERFASVDASTRKRHVVDRTLSCTISDLEVAFTGRLCDEGLSDVRLADGDGPRPRDAQIRLTTSSDDLVALTDGTLGVAGAWASGRLKVDASMMDVLRLRTLL